MKKKIVGIVIGMLLVTNVLIITQAKEESFGKEKTTSIVFSEPTIQVVNQYVTLDIAEATSWMMNPGQPLLPLYTKVFSFPFGTEIKSVECTPLQITQKRISGEIQPSPTPLLLTDMNTGNEPMGVEDLLIKDPSVYTSTEFYPYRWYDYRVSSGLDDTQQRVIVTIHVYPVQYSPGLQSIQCAKTIDIMVEYDEPVKSDVLLETYDMVIITPSEFSSQLQPLVAYKNDSSVATKLVTLDEIYDGVYFPANGRDEQETIKYFIKDAFEEWGITYVLLAGGANKIPVRMSYVYDGKEESLISDLYYADIYDAYGDFCSWDSNDNNIFGEKDYQGRTDTVDLYPDVCLGRLNFRDSSEVNSVIDKMILYESTGAYMEEWFSHFVVCGGDTFPDYTNVDEGEYLNQIAIDIMDGFSPEKIWVTNGKLQFASNIDNAIENGTGVFYMTGHGTFDTWATHPHNDFETWWPIGLYFYFRAEMLKNGEKLPVVFIGGCSNCQFLEDNCFGWSFVKNPDGGGIASFGNSALGWGYTGSACSMGLTGAMEVSAFNAYGVQNAKTTGELWTKALIYYLNQFGLWSSLDYKTVEEWQPFNDPSLRIAKVSDRPNVPGTISGPTSGEIGTEYTYSTLTTDPNGDLIKYCFDWGDGTVTWTERVGSGVNVSVTHTWEKPGEYAITVKARDTFGLDSAWSEPLDVTIVSDAPFLDITKIKGGVAKIKTVISNIGSVDASDVICNVSVTGGMLGRIDVFSEETLGALEVEAEKTMTAGGIFGVGKIEITVSVTAPSANTATKTVQGFVFGLVVVMRK